MYFFYFMTCHIPSDQEQQFHHDYVTFTFWLDQDLDLALLSPGYLSFEGISLNSLQKNMLIFQHILKSLQSEREDVPLISTHSFILFDGAFLLWFFWSLWSSPALLHSGNFLFIVSRALVLWLAGLGCFWTEWIHNLPEFHGVLGTIKSIIYNHHSKVSNYNLYLQIIDHFWSVLGYIQVKCLCGHI